MSGAACQRIKGIEAELSAGFHASNADVAWLIGQVRSWQKFAKRVVDFGDAVRQAHPTADVVSQGYENLFAKVE